MRKIIETKICSKCCEEKQLAEFPKQNGGKMGYRASCKSCCKAYREENRERILILQKKNYLENKAKYLEKRRIYKENNKEKIKSQDRVRYLKYYDKNKDIIKERKLKWVSENGSYQTSWRKKNRDKLNGYRKNTIDNLSDTYIVSLLHNQYGLKFSDIRANQDMIDLKKIIIKTKRLCKTSTS